MASSSNGLAGVTTVAKPSHSNGTTPHPGEAPAGPRSIAKTRHRTRGYQCPVLVEATVYWWRADGSKAACGDNQFGVMPAAAVRFRCFGTLMPKYPRRYRVELAQPLDRLPDLTRRELKQLGESLATAINKELGLEVAPFNGDVIDLLFPSAGG